MNKAPVITFTRILLVLVSLTGLKPAYAQESIAEIYPATYQVEVIAFERISADNLRAENWLAYPAIPKFSQAQDLNYQPLNGFSMLPPSSLRLNSTQQALERAGYKILFHKAWVQPALGRNDAKTLRLHGELENQNTIDKSPQHWRFDGTMKITKLNYFIVDANFLLNIPSQELNSFGVDSDALKRKVVSFNLHQKRRMRENELNYIDHPLYSLLIKITPMDA